VAIADANARPADASDGFAPGGIWALRIASGERVWHTPAPKVACSWGKGYCSAAQSAAVSAIPGVVFSGALNGHLFAYSTTDGSILWDFDTAAAVWETVNGMHASGGSIDGGGAAIADGMLLVNSGYARITGQRGNVLIAFSVNGK
jgi:polyvinyl alcohol dehydrogenase (cytochrome)